MLFAVFVVLKEVLSIIKQSKDFKNFLLSPILKTNTKIEIIRKVLETSISEHTLKHIILITKNTREAYLSQIISNFIKLYRKQKIF